MNLCKLCGLNPSIKNSHVIPSFITKWIKMTSATGYLRNVLKPNLRKQDGTKLELFCINCEGQLAKLEDTFASTIFKPFQSTNKKSFKYEEWLNKFIVMQSFRSALADLPQF